MSLILITVSLGFTLCLLLSLLLTPIAMRLGKHFDAMDEPNARKVHKGLIPRTGGLAIITVFLLGQLIFFYIGQITDHFFVDWRTVQVFWLGASFVVGAGIVDDFKRLPSFLKLLMQILAAVVVFSGGIRIDVFRFASIEWHLSFLPSCLLTIFWFVLLINAINLIDGLDGLAAGVVIFSTAVMSLMMIIGGNEKAAIAFGILTGSVVGFLRYNFNPAKIFMGDGGSYFLGFTLAFFSIHYVAKGHMGLSLFIPIIALGIPIFDVFVSPIRRFIIGRKIFQADKGHVHHRLLAMGLTTRRAVLMLYCASFVLALSTLLLVNLDNMRSGIIFLVLGIAAIVFVKKLGYFEYLAIEKIFCWLHDIRDVTGLSRSRRAFLGLEINIRESQTLDEMWTNVCLALNLKGFHKGWLHIYDRDDVEKAVRLCGINTVTDDFEKTKATYWFEGYDVKNDRPQEDVPNEWKLEIKIPLLAQKGAPMGMLYLVRDLKGNPLSSHTIRRIESLRRSLCVAVEKLLKESELLAGREEIVMKKKRPAAFFTRFLS